MMALNFNDKDLMKRLLGDQEMARKCIKGFLDDLPRKMSALRFAVEARDFAKIAEIAHRLKGSAANVSGEKLQNLAAQLESGAKASDQQGIRQSMIWLEAETVALTRLFETLVKPAGS